MADDLRIYQLADDQSGYSPSIYVVVDHVSFSNSKKMPIGDIYPKTNLLDATGTFTPSTTLLRVDNNSGDESKLSISNMLAEQNVIDIISTLGNTGWKTYALGDITKDSAKVDANTLVLSVISILGIVYFTGRFDTTSQLSLDETLFTLPVSIPTSTQNQYFNASDSQTSGSDENYELYIPANTRTVKNHSPSSSAGSQAVFSVTYPGI